MIESFLRVPRTPGEIAADAVRVAGALSIVVAAIWFSATDAGILALALPGLLLPRFVGVRAWFDITYGLTVLLATWSNVLDLYRSVPWWDIPAHAICTAVMAAVAYLALARLRVVPEPRSPAFSRRVPIVLVTVIGLALSALWEMVEWAGYAFITDEIYVTYVDTIGDMAAGGLGALAAGILLAYVRLDRDLSAANPAGRVRARA
ncbi:hypothetical protein ACFC3F_00970 [Microbacterium sp. NPDC055910]|uniref:hypothetical protein n=1 Tax=Microbacterium sp. NPDC055910 TaxID=3345659 RepID=UPI0035E21BEF